jgi:hypothetical protein
MVDNLRRERLTIACGMDIFSVSRASIQEAAIFVDRWHAFFVEREPRAAGELQKRHPNVVPNTTVSRRSSRLRTTCPEPAVLSFRGDYEQYQGAERIDCEGPDGRCGLFLRHVKNKDSRR